MFEIVRKFSFEAGHKLIDHDGNCHQPHGHSYRLSITLRSETLISQGPKKNMVYDFQDIKKIVTSMIDRYFEHKWLNDSLKNESPTAEFIAKWISDYLKPKLPMLYSVSLYETANSKVVYFS